MLTPGEPTRSEDPRVGDMEARLEHELNENAELRQRLQFLEQNAAAWEPHAAAGGAGEQSYLDDYPPSPKTRPRLSTSTGDYYQPPPYVVQGPQARTFRQAPSLGPMLLPARDQLGQHRSSLELGFLRQLFRDRQVALRTLPTFKVRLLLRSILPHSPNLLKPTKGRAELWSRLFTFVTRCASTNIRWLKFLRAQ